MSNIFFTADTHFSHHNMALLRGFSSAEEHDEILIQNINNMITRQDILYILGDMCWKNTYDVFYNRINCKNIHLILGNHDKPNLKNKKLFASVSQIKNIKLDTAFISMCHFPIACWDHSHWGSWHLHGHTHGQFVGSGKCYDAGVDNNNLKPISFDDVRSIMRILKDNNNLKTNIYF